MSDEHLLGERLLAERAERRRIAERLHDGPVQHVAALSQMLDAVVQALEAGDATAGERVATRALSGRARRGGGAARDRLRARARRARRSTGSPRRCGSWPSAPRGAAGLGSRSTSTTTELGDGAQSSLFQVIREALDQAVRRGPPTAARIVVRRTPKGGVELVVSDDGAPERRQAVLDGLAERAAELNGTFEASRADDRTTIRVVLPPSAAARLFAAQDSAVAECCGSKPSPAARAHP